MVMPAHSSGAAAAMGRLGGRCSAHLCHKGQGREEWSGVGVGWMVEGQQARWCLALHAAARE